jgi:membrane protein
VLDALRARLSASYPAAVVQRFLALELLDRSFGLAAQAFVALLPLVIVIVSLIFTDPATTMSNAISDRFGLDTAARAAIRSLFSSSGAEVTISWLAVVLSLLSAFSLSRRLARVYASIFGVTPLRRTQTWRGLVWVVLQVLLFVSSSALRDVKRDGGPALTVLAVIGLFVLWFAADFAGLRLLVPAAPRPQIIASAVTSMIGRLGITLWAAIYVPSSLSEQAAQYGPIGVTFAIFTYILAGVLVYVCAPLLVTTWVAWRRGRIGPSVAE